MISETHDRLIVRLPFTQEECDVANRVWGCNCGPSALAAALGVSLESVRPAVEAVGFREKGYLSPTMMKAALDRLNVRWTNRPIGAFDLGGMAFPRLGLARIQWEGPWTQPGANPRWAYAHTHWVASWKPRSDRDTAADLIDREIDPVIFDINGGLMRFMEWEEEIVPLITRSIPRADGDWHVTHCWEIEQ